jgi:4-alpha-glucanotransferase
MHIPNQKKRLTGLAVPLGALRTQYSIGVGEFPDLVELAHLCKACGIELIQLLPVNDSGFQSSPYSALTAFALHPLYLRISAMEEAKGFEPELLELKNRFEALPRFAYGPLQDAKLALLRKIFNKHKKNILASAEPGKKLHSWIQENPWIIDYAVYRRLKDAHNGAHWKEGPSSEMWIPDRFRNSGTTRNIERNISSGSGCRKPWTGSSPMQPGLSAIWV